MFRNCREDEEVGKGETDVGVSDSKLKANGSGLHGERYERMDPRSVEGYLLLRSPPLYVDLRSGFGSLQLDHNSAL